jgi:hypothetical protein
MRILNNLLRTAAGLCVMGLAACGTERDASPASDVSPAYEETAPLPHREMPQEPRRNGYPEPPADRHRAPRPEAPEPRLERGLDPLDFEADLRPRQRRNPVWVAIS